MKHRLRSVVGLLCFATLAGACGGSTMSGAGGGGGADAGTTGQGGSSAGGSQMDDGGVGGRGGGASGAGGASGVGGAGGAGTVGGGAGTDGGASSGAECQTADDCMIVNNCCGCRAEPKGATVPVCTLACIIDSCSAMQIGPTEVRCSAGRCVLDRSCNSANVTCNSPPPPCAQGSVPSVRNGCWGPCLAPTECRDVTNCSYCTGGSVCVNDELLGGNVESCVLPAAGCNRGNYCACLGACSVSCVETDAGVGCFCPTC